MDETAIWADMPGNSTIEVRGAHTVQIATTGHDKQRITICLAAFGDGTKLKPFIVFKGKRIPKEISNVHAAVIKMSDNGWMNEDLTMEWITTVWNDLVDPGSAKRMLVWDTFKCHFTSSVKSLLEESNTDKIIASLTTGSGDHNRYLRHWSLLQTGQRLRLTKNATQ